MPCHQGLLPLMKRGRSEESEKDWTHCLDAFGYFLKVLGNLTELNQKSLRFGNNTKKKMLLRVENVDRVEKPFSPSMRCIFHVFASSCSENYIKSACNRLWKKGQIKISLQDNNLIT